MSTSITREALVEHLARRPNLWLIGVAGIPGAGKSTLAGWIASQLPATAVIPMDGYHLPRRVLDAEQLRRRGSPPTFDFAALQSDLQRLRHTRSGIFPGWDHAAKDPAAGAIRVDSTATRILVEGNYLLLKSWQLGKLFDLTVFLDCDPAVAARRVEDRLVECGIVPDRTSARAQVAANDALNAVAILEDGCFDRADFVVNG